MDDQDNPIWTKADFARASGPEALGAAELEAFPRTTAKLGRPKPPTREIAVKPRLDPDILVGSRPAASGWQTRIYAVLREIVTTRRT